MYVGIYTYFCVTLMLVLGLQMFMGNSGILNWTYVGFVGIGAYAASILSTAPLVKQMGVPNMYPALVKLQMPVLPAVLVGGLVAAAIAAVIAWPLMRLSDAVGVITLFATLIVIHVIMTQWDNVTNGPRTFFGVPAVHDDLDRARSRRASRSSSRTSSESRRSACACAPRATTATPPSRSA